MVKGYEFVCPECRTESAIRFDSRGEAEYFTTVHDRMIHAGRPTCTVRAVRARPWQAVPCGLPTAHTPHRLCPGAAAAGSLTASVTRIGPSPVEDSASAA